MLTQRSAAGKATGETIVETYPRIVEIESEDDFEKHETSVAPGAVDSSGAARPGLLL